MINYCSHRELYSAWTARVLFTIYIINKVFVLFLKLKHCALSKLFKTKFHGRNNAWVWVAEAVECKTRGHRNEIKHDGLPVGNGFYCCVFYIYNRHFRWGSSIAKADSSPLARFHTWEKKDIQGTKAFWSFFRFRSSRVQTQWSMVIQRTYLSIYLQTNARNRKSSLSNLT